jgi:DNA-binding NarL/FixJ family response regulator
MTDEVRILLADDHPVVRKGLKLCIEEGEGFKVVAEAGDGEAALALVQKLRTNLAILDIDMPKSSGLQVAAEIKRLKLNTKVIFLSFHKDEQMVRAALDAGGNGYLLKDSAMQEIVAAVQTVMSGQVYVSSAIALQLLQGGGASKRDDENSLTSSLTPSERRILFLIADGLSSKEIGATLSVHYRTIENHRTNICRKLGIEGANALLRFAVQHKGDLR